jgi:hypothetical protein
MSVSWLNKDVGNIIKEFSDPLTYFRLLRVSRVFQPTNQERYLQKLKKYHYILRRNHSGKRITRSMTKRRRSVFNKLIELGYNRYTY